MSTLQVANVQFETTGTNRIEYTGNNVIRVRANGGFQLPFGTTAQRAAGETGLMRYNTDTGLVESWGGSGTWDALPTGPVFNVAYGVANAAYTTANNSYSFGNTVYAAVNSAFAVINAAFTAQNTDYTSSNAAYVVANAAFGKANTALQNTSGTFAGNLAVTGTIKNDDYGLTQSGVSDGYWFNSISTRYTGVYSSDGGLTFRIANDDGAMKLANTRYLGIGTSSPSYRLHVNGTGYASSDFRAPIFYDSDNTGYYVDAAGTTILNNISAATLSISTGTAGPFVYLKQAGGTYGVTAANSAIVLTTDNASGNPVLATELQGSVTGYLNATGAAFFPIYYDYNNTGYYVDPASTSYINTLSLATGTVTGLTGTSGSSFVTAGGSSENQLGVNFSGQYMAYMFNNASGWGLYSQSGGIILYYERAGSRVLLNGPYTEANGSLRAPVFYDSNDTGWYTDPAGTSVLNYSNLYSLNLNRSGSARSGISWYASSYASWNTYMSPAGATGSGPYAYLTAPSGTYVTSWALRNVIEAAAGYGWTWETNANNGSTPTIRAELRYDGLFYAPYFWSSSDTRGPIFYDQNDTAYYCDPNSTTRLNNATFVGTGGRTLLATLTASNSATLATTALAGYRYIEVLFSNIVPVTTSVDIYIQWYASGAYQTSGYQNYIAIFNTGGSQGYNATTAVILGAGGRVSNTAGSGYCGRVLLFNANQGTGYKQFIVDTGGLDSTTNYSNRTWGQGNLNVTAAITGFQFYASSGNISTGTIQVWGWN